MKIKEIVSHFESIAPTSLQEKYDNSGLQVGSAEQDIERALICVDCTEDVVNEAVEKNCGLIISHHPLIFDGLKRLTGSDHVQRTILKAIKNDIALYAIHTNLDNVIEGVNGRLADVLGIKAERVIRPMTDRLLKLCVHVPVANFEKVRNALFAAGAGVIGDYSECSFSVKGQGTFKPEEGAEPSTGQIGERESVEELRLEVILFKWRKRQVLAAMNAAHEYEEVAYELVELGNEHLGLGSGLLGSLPEPISEDAFIDLVKSKLMVPFVRHSAKLGTSVQRIAICGGSGSFLLEDAIALGADAFVTADLKYHQFQEPDNQLLMIDAGHYETERSTMQLLRDLMVEKFPKFAIHLTETVSNPIHYA